MSWDMSYWGPDGPDLSRWNGAEMRRGAAYKVTGASVADGTKNQVRKISQGRKHRGMASDHVPDFQIQEEEVSE